MILLNTAFCFGQNTNIERSLDSLFTQKFKPAEPGCAVLVAKAGQVIYKKAFGSAHLELNVPLSADMVFRLASVTKQFTAVAVLQLVEQAKIGLKDSLQKYIPDFPHKGSAITIENLLTHTSGIRDYMQIDFSNNTNMERWDFEPKELIDSFKHYPLQFQPGTKFSYSNSGYYLLGYIIEKVSGKTYQKYVHDHILSPLNLSHSYFEIDGVIIPNRVNGYRKNGPQYTNADYWSPAISYAAGGLLSNTQDLFDWFQALLSNKLLKKETLEKAFTPFKLANGSLLSYGYGWYVYPSGNAKSIEHAGIMNGFTSNQIYYPDKDVFIALLFNNQDAATDEISKTVSEIVLGQSLEKSIKIGDDILNRYVGTYALSTDAKRTIVITKKDAALWAKVSGQQTFEIIFQGETKFGLKSIKDIAGEFINENGKVTKLVVEQNGRFEWNKIK